MSIEKNRFVVDENNRLRITSPSKKLSYPLEGKFKIDRHNRLLYYVKDKSSWHRKYGLGDVIEFTGKWSLNKTHDLVLNLDNTRRKLVLKGELFDYDKNTLIFKIKSKKEKGFERISFLKLKGKWRTDRFNRIMFEVTKKDRPDTLVFKNAWNLDKNNQIVYRYKKTKKKVGYSLKFKGYWYISSYNRLAYILERGKKISGRSFFDFRAYLETPTIYPHKNKIRYRIGVGVRKEKKERVISFYGVCKFKKKLGVVLEIHKGKKIRMDIGTALAINRQDKIMLYFKNGKGKPLGLHLVLEKKSRFYKNLIQSFYFTKDRNKFRVGVRLIFKF